MPRGRQLSSLWRLPDDTILDGRATSPTISYQSPVENGNVIASTKSSKTFLRSKNDDVRQTDTTTASLESVQVELETAIQPGIQQPQEHSWKNHAVEHSANTGKPSTVTTHHSSEQSDIYALPEKRDLTHQNASRLASNHTKYQDEVELKTKRPPVPNILRAYKTTSLRNAATSLFIDQNKIWINLKQSNGHVPAKTTTNYVTRTTLASIPLQSDGGENSKRVLPNKDSIDGTATKGRTVSPESSLPPPITITTTKPVQVLVGIFSGDFAPDFFYRNQFRDLFSLDNRICSLAEFKRRFQNGTQDSSTCELIYTFVAGGDPRQSTELVDGSRPMTIKKPRRKPTAPDFTYEDITLLNIRENMNEGKSQTWFAYAGRVVKEYDIDYIVKQDTDTILYLDKYFDFVKENLPPSPYNKNILTSYFYDKHWWPKNDLQSKKNHKAEKFLKDKYGMVLHLYATGQFYLMSPDLAKTVAETARNDENLSDEMFGHEDHDVSTMAHHTKKPIHLIFVDKPNLFWRHGVKIKKRDFKRKNLHRSKWHQIWEDEKTRIQSLC